MIKSKFQPPYKADGSTNFRRTVNKSGVYIIKSKKTDQVLYVGHSKTNLYRTMYRHFQSWSDNSQVRVTYRNRDAYLVRVVLSTPARAFYLEQALIAKLKPKDNPNKISLKDIEEETRYQKELNEYIRENVRTDVPF